MENAKIMYEDEKVIIKTTGRDYDFLATIENKTDFAVSVTVDENSTIRVDASDWIGILADEEGQHFMEQVQSNNITVE